MNGLFNLFIRSVDIDWTRIERNSYLREIPALAGAERIDFARNITFFVEVAIASLGSKDAVVMYDNCCYYFYCFHGYISFNFSNDISMPTFRSKSFLRSYNRSISCS